MSTMFGFPAVLDIILFLKNVKSINPIGFPGDEFITTKNCNPVQPPNGKFVENQYQTHHFMQLSHHVTKLLFHDTALQI